MGCAAQHGLARTLSCRDPQHPFLTKRVRHKSPYSPSDNLVHLLMLGKENKLSLVFFGGIGRPPPEIVKQDLVKFSLIQSGAPANQFLL